ncbi:MAG TPA: MltA domain-containing protein [Planctomycetota bacterium]|jgi:membrane-bound lytic murein transglycosylase A|nr:MltA domain-containing protein [Planctomycetota bacterium]NMD37032.1 murein transglycosylase [Planctomycetota bacterium]HNS00683.1 MltA domain-containing protein [Planctomycetota bacterium]HNU27471.1 MltA domain-containing protein [Planctomycetota bacterium]HOR69034.1 MltA domain-containing protein [Planctomycetota bacterium]
MMRTRWLVFLLAALGAAAGCRRQEVIKDYARPLPPGALGLRKITDPAELPDLKTAYASIDGSLDEALARSLAWMAKPSAARYFPAAGVTFEHAARSLAAFRKLLDTCASAADFEQRVLEDFDVYTSIGWDGNGTVLFTGYYAPVFNASKEQTVEYRYPLYTRPPDLEVDPATGETRGRRAGGALVPYATRAEIENSRMLAGRELVWLKDKFAAYVIHVNGSAKLVLPDGSVMYVGYAGNNGHPYTSVGDILVQEKKLDPDKKGLAAMRDFFAGNPAQADRYLHRNDRFVFFQEYASANWPAGSLGFKVTPERTLATDKSVFPRAGVTLVQTKIGGQDGGKRPFLRFMLDQDTGGAIRAPGRGDIYMGIGPKAEFLAGRQAEEGRLYYFFLKPKRM